MCDVLIHRRTSTFADKNITEQPFQMLFSGLCFLLLACRFGHYDDAQ